MIIIRPTAPTRPAAAVRATQARNRSCEAGRFSIRYPPPGVNPIHRCESMRTTPRISIRCWQLASNCAATSDSIRSCSAFYAMVDRPSFKTCLPPLEASRFATEGSIRRGHRGLLPDLVEELAEVATVARFMPFNALRIHHTARPLLCISDRAPLRR